MPTSTTSRHARALIGLAIGTLLLGLLAPAAAADGGLEVTTPYPAVAVAPGSKASFDLSVTSTREGNVLLALDAVPAGWTASLHGGGFVVDGVLAGPGRATEVRLDVSVPGDAAATTQTLRVVAALGATRDVLPITVRINEAAAGDITLTTPSPTLAGPSDGTFDFTLTLQNDTAQDVTVSVASSGPSGWTVEAQITGQEQAASTIVKAGSSTGLRVTATPPKDAPAGSYPISVEVQAGERTVSAQLGIEITGTFSMTLETPDDRVSANGSAGSATRQTFNVTNTGTGALDSVALSGSGPTNWTVEFDPPTVGPLQPGESVTATAIITPSGDAVAGDYVVTVEATNEQVTADVSQQIRFTVETSPIWALVGLGIIVAIVGGLFYVFRTYGRR